MKPERWHQIENLYHEALEMKESRREAFLREACASDDDLRRELERLLAGERRAADFLEKPALREIAHEFAGTAAPSWVGRQIGNYQLVSLIGTGGMGEVYRARDVNLKRDVAIKVLPDSFARDTERVARFQREAEMLASLNHPHIAAIYDLEKFGELRFLVLELVEGETLADRLTRGPIPVVEASRMASEILEALEAAHEKGIIHRDLKPANIKLTPEGQVKVLDFGLAKGIAGVPTNRDLSNSPTLSIEQTNAGVILGTPAYMSPEQAEGRTLDARSDIFAFGVVFYEMLCGKKPFRGESTLAILASILREDPQPLRQARPVIPADVEPIVVRCLAKRAEDRYASAADAAHDLEQIGKPVVTGVMLRRPVVAVLALVLVVGLGIVGILWYMRSSGARWAETQALPQAAQLMESSQPLAALKLLDQAERYSPSSPEFIRLKEDLVLLPTVIETAPPGAEIYATDYADPKAPDYSHWEKLGRSPLKTDRLPRDGYYRIRAVKDGFEPVEAAVFSGRPSQLQLHTKEETPPGMVWVPSTSGTVRTVNVHLPVAEVPAVWMDRYEVTNRQFKEFVDAGGYEKREYWKQPFFKDGKELTWEQAMDDFRDAARRSGPSTWDGGYPDGKADFPVGGVSWYEAAAYAEFAGKSLPTVYHWYTAASLSINSQITSQSNFGGQGPVPGGSNLGMARYGTYDMAGNVKEWTENRSGEKRYILGGGWTESSYMFQQDDTRSPWERGATFGFRCVRYISPVPDALTGPLAGASTDRSHDQPVDDRTFQVFKSFFSYDKTDLEPALDSVTDSPHWRRENLSFRAPYGNERVILHLYLPKGAAPPYQAVFFFGGNNMLTARQPEEVATRLMEYIIKSGRAVVLPAYAGTLERGPTPQPSPPRRARDRSIQQFKDAARSVDYLETRRDIDITKIGFYGVSLGTGVGLKVLSLDPRFKVGVFVSAGTRQASSPEVDGWNYAPRVKVPVVMLNGRDDSIGPVETSQWPLFKALGTSEKDKRYITYPGGHVDFQDRQEVIKEALDWLDHYLGAVKLQR